MRFALAALYISASFAADPGSAILLWPQGAPGSNKDHGPESVRITPQGEHVISGVHAPSITPYLPPKSEATGSAVIVAPGGGHRELWSDHEGHNVARWLSEHGVAAFVLKYRLARESGSTYTVEEHALADIQRAIVLVKEKAPEWGIQPERTGVMGFSAGGEIAALAALRWTADPASRPAFQALIYPGSGKSTPVFSKETPPAFLLCGENDRRDISQGLAELYVAMKKAGVSAELHSYAGVGHGFGLRPTLKGPVAGWIQIFHAWLEQRPQGKKP